MIRRAARQIGDGLDPEIDIEMLTPAAPITQIMLGQKVKTARHPVAVRRRPGARERKAKVFTNSVCGQIRLLSLRGVPSSRTLSYSRPAERHARGPERS